MIYGLEQGRTEKVILEQCRRDRSPIPDAIQNAPELDQGSDFFLHAYLELSSCRYSDGPIPWGALAEYAYAHDVNGELLDEMMFIVRHVDSDIMEYRARKAEEKSKAAAKNRTR